MNIRQVKKKIKSVGNVKKITRSMQLVSAIKMKKAQQAAIEARPYQEKIEKIIKAVTGKLDSRYSALLQKNVQKQGKKLVICIASNKGLCGSFNVEFFRFMVKNIDFSNTEFLVVGKKASQFIAKMGGVILADYSSSTPQNSVSALFDESISRFLSGTHSDVSLFYNRFISTLHIEPTFERLLPMKHNDTNPLVAKSGTEYLIEPDPATILDSLLRSFVEERIRNSIIQSEAGEHSARMIAMKNATDNAVDVMYNLTLLSNKLRQERITGELLDMITAKESVGA